MISKHRKQGIFTQKSSRKRLFLCSLFSMAVSKRTSHKKAAGKVCSICSVSLMAVSRRTSLKKVVGKSCSFFFDSCKQSLENLFSNRKFIFDLFFTNRTTTCFYSIFIISKANDELTRQPKPAGWGKLRDQTLDKRNQAVRLSGGVTCWTFSLSRKGSWAK